MTSQNPFGASFWLVIAALSAAALGCFGYAGLQLPVETPTRQRVDADERPKAALSRVTKQVDADERPKAALSRVTKQVDADERPTRSPVSFVRTGSEHASL